MSNETAPQPDQPDPFDLEALREAPDLDAFDVEKILTTVPVRKPRPNEFVRVRDSVKFTVDGWTLEHESGLDRTMYWVSPDMRVILRDHLRKVRLYVAINKRSNVFLWPCRLPTADSNSGARSWYQSALRAAEQAKVLWVKISGNKDIGAYDMVVARGDLGDPQWPGHTFQQLLEIAFRDKIIDRLDHEVIKEIEGEI
jgi:hypothetical protein